MKMNQAFTVSRNFLYLSLVFSMVLSLGSCARKISFENSPVVPAATGRVKIKKDKNNNYSIGVSVKNLAEAKRLDPPRDTYVVWIETDCDGTKNIGQMNSSSGFLSSKLKASLNAVSPFKPTRVFITAEDNAAVQYPGLNMIMRTKTF